MRALVYPCRMSNMFIVRIQNCEIISDLLISPKSTKQKCVNKFGTEVLVNTSQDQFGNTLAQALLYLLTVNPGLIILEFRRIVQNGKSSKNRFAFHLLFNDVFSSPSPSRVLIIHRFNYHRALREISHFSAAFLICFLEMPRTDY